MALERVLDMNGFQRLGVLALPGSGMVRVRIYNEDWSIRFEGMFSPNGESQIEYRFDTIDLYEINPT